MNSSSFSLLKPDDVTLSLTLPPCPNNNSPNEGIKPEERGIKLIQLLLTCAKDASSGNLHRADECLRQISELSSVTGDSMQRLAAHFASSLATRLVKRWPGLYKALNQNHHHHHHHRHHHQHPKQQIDHFSQALLFPYIGFSYAIISQSLIHFIASEEGVIHIIDLGSCDPKFWIPLLRGISTLLPNNGRPHYLKVTCVSRQKHVLDQLGRKLNKEAESLDNIMPFLLFNPINVDLKDLTVEMLKVGSGEEALVLISVLNLHVLLAEDDRVDAHFGAKRRRSDDGGVKECKQMGQFLGMVRSMSPKLFFLVEQEADHNLNRLVDRFVEGLHYYSAVFDSMNNVTFGTKTTSEEERLILEEMFGREIENIVASEGIEREERHERYARWMVRFDGAGFKPVHLWADPRGVVEQMVEASGRDGYRIVNERTSWMICWYDRPLYAVSAWTC